MHPELSLLRDKESAGIYYPTLLHPTNVEAAHIIPWTWLIPEAATKI